MANINEELVIGDLLKIEKIPYTDRLLKAAVCFFGQTLAGIAMAFVAPFAALRILFASERKVPDLSKIPLYMMGIQDALPGILEGTPGEQVRDANNQVLDMFDMREPWKKEHDKEFGEDEEAPEEQ